MPGVSQAQLWCSRSSRLDPMPLWMHRNLGRSRSATGSHAAQLQLPPAPELASGVPGSQVEVIRQQGRNATTTNQEGCTRPCVDSLCPSQLQTHIIVGPYTGTSPRGRGLSKSISVLSTSAPVLGTRRREWSLVHRLRHPESAPRPIRQRAPWSLAWPARLEPSNVPQRHLLWNRVPPSISVP